MFSELACFLATFLQEKQIEEVYLIDGGCDSLMTGKELGLGTPSEDLFSMKVMQRATQIKGIPIKLAVIGVDIDTAHGIKLKDLNRRLRKLKPLWTWNWSLQEQCLVHYREIFYQCDPHHSIVHSLVVGALNGLQGYVVPSNLTKRLRKTLVPITPRLRTMFCYDLRTITKACLFWPFLHESMTYSNVDKKIGDLHEQFYFQSVLKRILKLKNMTHVINLCWEYVGELL